MPLESWKEKVILKTGSVKNVVYNSKKISFSVNLPKEEAVRVNTIYYPGWTFFVDGVKTGINYNNSFGVMDITVKSGTHFVKGEFSETLLRVLSDFISLFSILGLVIYLVVRFGLRFKKS
jgi:hypothetical protein